MSWQPNPGYCPGLAKGKRVKVRLRNGRVCGDKPIANGVPAGWHADATAPGKGPPINWNLTGGDFDVIEWDFV